MGKYINEDSKGNELPAIGKVKMLIADGAQRCNIEFRDNLVCVVENDFFDAAGYVETNRDFMDFNHPYDDRPKTWLVYEHVKKLAR